MEISTGGNDVDSSAGTFSEQQQNGWVNNQINDDDMILPGGDLQQNDDDDDESDGFVDENKKSYEEIMGLNILQSAQSNTADDNAVSSNVLLSGGGVDALSERLRTLREWLTKDANITIHPSLCIVNGESTDGTKGAPVITLVRDDGLGNQGNNTANSSGSVGGTSTTTSPAPPPPPLSNIAPNSGRCGMIDSESDRQLYDRTLGCQLRAANQIKDGSVVMTVPKSSMVTPDIVAASDAGYAIYKCINNNTSNNEKKCSFDWFVFENTTICENKFRDKLQRNTGTQLFFKILQERKKAETAIQKFIQRQQQQQQSNNSSAITLIQPGAISSRAPILLFLIHQRFSNCINTPISSSSKQSNTYKIPTSTPKSFSPYVRTLPSTVPLPICWKRNELAFLKGCISGLQPLIDIAVQTSHLVSEFTALVDAGITTRFPTIFPKGLITWERYVWAYSVYTSRVLPVSCYLNEGEDQSIRKMKNVENDSMMQSPFDIWNELGVMIPLLDMLNHDSESSQITWEPCVPKSRNRNSGSADDDGEALLFDDDDDEGPEPHPPRGVLHKKLKKSSQLYTSYGNKSNHELILQYGFAQLNNPADEVKMGWGLTDAVGNVSPPDGYVCILPDVLSSNKDEVGKNVVYDSSDGEAVNIWWSDDRLTILEKEALVSDNNMAMLKMGKKLQTLAYSDGTIHPVFLTSAVVGTMPPKDVDKYIATHVKSNGDGENKTKDNKSDGNDGSVVITRTHQRILRQYLAFVFARKLEKLLQNLSNGLKDHFSNVQLWTKASEGGLYYNSSNSGDKGSDKTVGTSEVDIDVKKEPSTDGIVYTGWQSFFDMYAYNTTLESEEGQVYYAVGPDSCVLTLYDGHLRCLQASIDALSTESNFEKNVLKQLKDLNYTLLDAEDEDGNGGDGGEGNTTTAIKSEGRSNSSNNIKTEQSAVKEEAKATNNRSSTEANGKQKGKQKSGGKQESGKKESGGKAGGEGGGGGKRRRNRNKNKGGGSSGNNGGATDRPPAIKLHIGNLSYQTKPADLYDFFGGLYGRENVLECHIPTERETGRSRGFGFVTMPEAVSMKALNSGRKHEIGGRLLKVAQSNSAGSNVRGNRGSVPPPAAAASDRCTACGYRPKYCTCSKPNMPGSNGYGGRGGGRGDMMYGSQHPYPPDDHIPPRDDYGGGGRGGGGYGYAQRNSSYDYDYDYYGSRSGSRHRSRGRRSYSRSMSPPRRGSGNRSTSRGDDGYGDDRDRDRDRGYREYRYDRSRSPSYSRDRDMDRSRRERGGRSSRDRSRDSGRRSRDSWDGGGRSARGRSWSSGRSRSFSPNDRNAMPRGGRSLSRSASPPHSRSSAMEPDRKRGGNEDRHNRRRRSRSRSSGRGSRSEKRKRRKRERSRSRSRADSHSRGDQKDP